MISLEQTRRIAYVTSRAVSFTPWRPCILGIGEPGALRDMLDIIPANLCEWDRDRQAYVATGPDGGPVFYFALESRTAEADAAEKRAFRTNVKTWGRVE